MMIFWCVHHQSALNSLRAVARPLQTGDNYCTIAYPGSISRRPTGPETVLHCVLNRPKDNGWHDDDDDICGRSACSEREGGIYRRTVKDLTKRLNFYFLVKHTFLRERMASRLEAWIESGTSDNVHGGWLIILCCVCPKGGGIVAATLTIKWWLWRPFGHFI